MPYVPNKQSYNNCTWLYRTTPSLYTDIPTWNSRAPYINSGGDISFDSTPFGNCPNITDVNTEHLCLDKYVYTTDSKSIPILCTNLPNAKPIDKFTSIAGKFVPYNCDVYWFYGRDVSDAFVSDTTNIDAWVYCHRLNDTAITRYIYLPKKLYRALSSEHKANLIGKRYYLSVY